MPTVQPLVELSRKYTSLLACMQAGHPVQLVMPCTQTIWGKVKHVDVNDVQLEDWAGAQWVVSIADVRSVAFGAPVIEYFREQETAYLAAVRRSAGSAAN